MSRSPAFSSKPSRCAPPYTAFAPVSEVHDLRLAGVSVATVHQNGDNADVFLKKAELWGQSICAFRHRHEALDLMTMDFRPSRAGIKLQALLIGLFRSHWVAVN